MTVSDWLRETTRSLKQADIPSARLDALILLEDATGKDRAWLLAHPEHVFQDLVLEKANIWCGRRANHEPLAYIRGKSEFYGREFNVTPATLQPRSETETIIELLLDQVKGKKLKVKSIVDVGTGSGCLAITAKLELPECNVFATEINDDALKIAKENAETLGAGVDFYQGNLLDPLLTLNSELLTGKLAILANLPYVPDSHTINQAAMQEPKIAIFGGEDGLDLYRELFSQVSSAGWRIKNQVSLILTESLPFQHDELAAIATACNYKLSASQDLIQVFEPA